MGFFSWITQDTGRSICNTYSDRPTFKVIMLDNKGNKYVEENYEGYGVFGGKDFYELLAEMNGLSTRDDGIDLCFMDNPSGDNTPGVLYPNLVESEDWEWCNFGPVSCSDQGYFYSNHEDEDYLIDEYNEDYPDEDDGGYSRVDGEDYFND